jgi:hypothetical protein
MSIPERTGYESYTLQLATFFPSSSTKKESAIPNMATRSSRFS